MLIIPLVALMTQPLYEEFRYWLHHKGTDEEVATNEMAFAFLGELEGGAYEVPETLRTEVHRLYFELRRSSPIKPVIGNIMGTGA